MNAEIPKEGFDIQLGSYDEAMRKLEFRILERGSQKLQFIDWSWDGELTQPETVRVITRFRVVQAKNPLDNDVEIRNSCPIAGRGEVFLNRTLAALGIVWNAGESLRSLLEPVRGRVVEAIISPTEGKTAGPDGKKPVFNNIEEWISGSEVVEKFRTR